MSGCSSESVLLLARGGISRVGEGNGLVSDGVSTNNEVVVLELERECVFRLVLSGLPPKVLRDGILVIAQRASSGCIRSELENECEAEVVRHKEIEGP